MLERGREENEGYFSGNIVLLFLFSGHDFGLCKISWSKSGLVRLIVFVARVYTDEVPSTCLHIRKFKSSQSDF